MIFRLDQRGFTLLEVLGAIAVLTFGALSLLQLQMSTVHNNTVANSLTQGIIVADQTIEDLLARPYNTTTDQTLIDCTDPAATVCAATCPNGWATCHQQTLVNPATGTFNIFWNVTDNTPANFIKTVNVVVQWNVQNTPKSISVDFLKGNI